jgi:hypothetical protein
MGQGPGHRVLMDAGAEVQQSSPQLGAKRFREAFGSGPVGLSLVTVCTRLQAVRDTEAGWRAGCQGVFLTAGPSADFSEFLQVVRCVSSAHRDAWLGLRLPKVPSAEELDSLLDECRNLWIADLGVDPDWLGEEIDRIRCTEQWDGLLFGALATTQTYSDDISASAVSISRFVDVVVATVPAERDNALRQVRSIKHALGNFPLAVALRPGDNSIDGLARVADCLICPARAARPAGSQVDARR